jgi:hypothetical protein
MQKKKKENDEQFKETLRTQKNDFNAKKKEENEELFKENTRLQKKRFRSNVREENEEQFKETLRTQKNSFNAKKKEENEEMFKENARLQKKRFRSKVREENEEQYKEDTRLQKQKCRENERVSCGRPERLKKFRNAVKYGAIFVCISCKQRLFENGVTTVTEYFKESVNSKKTGLFYECVTEEDQEINGKKANYICHTCKETMKRGKMLQCQSKTDCFW